MERAKGPGAAGTRARTRNSPGGGGILASSSALGNILTARWPIEIIQGRGGSGAAFTRQKPASRARPGRSLEIVAIHGTRSTKISEERSAD